jgi:hypothetical protein
MAIKLEKFEVKNSERGGAKVLANFSVNFGAITINDFALVEYESKTFLSEPHRRYTKQGETKPKRFSYVWFNNGKGTQLKGEIENLALAEYERRNGPKASVKSPQDDDDDLPF